MLQKIKLFFFLFNSAQYISGEIPSVELKNAARPGTQMPFIGLGTGGYGHDPSVKQPEDWDIPPIPGDAVQMWLQLGGKRIDAALSYLNQVEIGKAIKASGKARNSLFITSKVGPGKAGTAEHFQAKVGMGYNQTMMQFDEILKSLGTNYIDLLLLHWPGVDNSSGTWINDSPCINEHENFRFCRQESWRALQDIYKQGRAKAIGVANFEQNHLQDILDMQDLLPAVNQVEFHPYWHENELVKFCHANDITFNGYASLGTPDFMMVPPQSIRWPKHFLQLQTVKTISQLISKTPAQVVLRWSVQQGILVNPRMKSQTHMKENLAIFDFQLSTKQMQELSSLSPPKQNKVCPDPHLIP